MLRPIFQLFLAGLRVFGGAGWPTAYSSHDGGSGGRRWGGERGVDGKRKGGRERAKRERVKGEVERQGLCARKRERERGKRERQEE